MRAGARPPADLYGSGSYWCPTLLAGGLRVDLRASGLSIAFAMTDATKPTAGGFPLFPGERLEAQAAMEWIRAAKTQLTPDWTALIAGQEPRSVLKYKHSTILPPLVANSTTGITQNAVETRQAMIQTMTDSNELKTLERDAHMSELEHSFFTALDIVVEPKYAPLLLRRMMYSQLPLSWWFLSSWFLSSFRLAGVSARDVVHSSRVTPYIHIYVCWSPTYIRCWRSIVSVTCLW